MFLCALVLIGGFLYSLKLLSHERRVFLSDKMECERWDYDVGW
jgi:hypothetical protein